MLQFKPVTFLAVPQSGPPPTISFSLIAPKTHEIQPTHVTFMVPFPPSSLRITPVLNRYNVTFCVPQRAIRIRLVDEFEQIR
jgi:hypothetical protein